MAPQWQEPPGGKQPNMGLRVVEAARADRGLKGLQK